MSYDPKAYGALCDQCPLQYQRPVPPSGWLNADVVIVGESPGFQDVKTGRQMTGPAGQLIDEFLENVSLDRAHVWITSTILCRPEVPDLQGPKRYDLATFLAYVRSSNAKAKKLAKMQGTVPRLVTDPISCCQVRLYGELKYFEEKARARGRPNGSVVVPMGNYASQTVTGIQSGIMKVRGSPIPITMFDPPSGVPNT